jgi:hypothetical protein
MKQSLFTIVFTMLCSFVFAQGASGTYQTDFNDLTIQQSGNQITGSYSFLNGRIEGTLEGHTLTGWWYQSNGKGRLLFEFNYDFSGFVGKWNYNEAAPSSKWNGSRIASQVVQNSDPKLEGSSASYTTTFQDLTLTFISNNRVRGTYKFKDGEIDGILNGHTLSGTWTQSNANGLFVFEFNDDFTNFTGKWGYNDAVPISIWNGTRK